MADFRNSITHDQSRGISDNNPMNVNHIGWNGEVGYDGQEAIFSDTTYGLRAGAMVLYKYYYKDNLKTLYQIFSKYAPTNDPNANNDPNVYANYVGKKLGIGVNEDIQLDGQNIVPLMRAMMEQELGQKYADMISDEDIVQGVSMTNKAEIMFYKAVSLVKDNPLTSIAIIVLTLGGGVLYYRYAKSKKII